MLGLAETAANTGSAIHGLQNGIFGIFVYFGNELSPLLECSDLLAGGTVGHIHDILIQIAQRPQAAVGIMLQIQIPFAGGTSQGGLSDFFTQGHFAQ